MDDVVFYDDKLLAYVTSLVETSNIASFMKNKIDTTADPVIMRTSEKYKRFWNLNNPTLDIDEYRQRLSTYLHFDAFTEIIAIEYLRRLLDRGVIFHARNLHRLLVTAIVLAQKYNDENIQYSAKYYSRSSGIKTGEFMLMEINFCDILDWEMFVGLNKVENFIRSIENELHCSSSV
tara:strand:- start:10020 stop:10550 length:531 start_codon:yes stop_codon:yes gene_type:complete